MSLIFTNFDKVARFSYLQRCYLFTYFFDIIKKATIFFYQSCAYLRYYQPSRFFNFCHFSFPFQDIVSCSLTKFEKLLSDWTVGCLNPILKQVLLCMVNLSVFLDTRVSMRKSVYLYQSHYFLKVQISQRTLYSQVQKLNIH